jgi:Homeodomain-like domain
MEDPSMKKYTVKLTQEEREELKRVAHGKKGKQNIAAWKVVRAKVLLKCDQGAWGPKWADVRLAAAFDLSVRCLERWRQRAVEEGPLSILERKPRLTPPVSPKLDGKGEAQLTKLACSVAPKGRSRWTLRLLADHLVELAVVPSISHETVRRHLKKAS